MRKCKTPVNEPGPAFTAMAESSSAFVSVLSRSASSIGMSVLLCVRAVSIKNEPMILSSSARQTDAALAVVSTANIFKCYTFYVKYSLIITLSAGDRYSQRVFGQRALDILAPLDNKHSCVEIIKKSR